MMNSKACKGMLAFAAVPLIAFGGAQPAFAGDGVGTSETNSNGVGTITKSSDIASLPAIGDTITYSVTAHFTEAAESNSFIRDTFDPTKLRFVEARVQVSLDTLNQIHASVQAELFSHTGFINASTDLNERLALNPGLWDPSFIAETLLYIESRIDELYDLGDAAEASGDEAVAQSYYQQLAGWYAYRYAVSGIAMNGMASLDTFTTRFDESAEQHAENVELNALVEGYIAGASEGYTFIPAKTTVGDGTFEIAYPRFGSVSTFPEGDLVVEYDMIYLGGDMVANEACAISMPTLPTIDTEPSFMREWVAPAIIDEEIDLAADAPETCATLTLAAPETNVHVVKQVKQVGDDGYVVAPEWSFEIVTDDFTETGTTTADGYDWLLPLSTEPRDITLREMAAPNALLTDYDLTSVECSIGDTVLPSTVDTESQTVTVPAVPAGSKLSCTFNNDQIPGTVIWEKIDAQSKTMLAGAIFEITGRDNVIRVEDCVEAPCTLADTDARPGKFSVTNLPWGDYTLAEVEAPNGYVLGEAVQTFSVGSGALTVDAGTFENTAKAEKPGVDLANTGSSVATLWISFGAATMLAIGSALALIRRRKPVHQG